MMVVTFNNEFTIKGEFNEKFNIRIISSDKCQTFTELKEMRLTKTKLGIVYKCYPENDDMSFEKLLPIGGRIYIDRLNEVSLVIS